MHFFLCVLSALMHYRLSAIFLSSSTVRRPALILCISCIYITQEMFVRNSVEVGEGQGVAEDEAARGPDSDRAWSVDGVGARPDSPTSLTVMRGTRGTDSRPSTALKGRRGKEKEKEREKERESGNMRMRGVDNEREGFGEGVGGREINGLGGLEVFEESIGEEGEEEILDNSAASKMGKSVERDNENTKKIVHNTELEKNQFFGKNEFPSPRISNNEEPAVSMIIEPSPRSLKSASRNSREISKYVYTENTVLSPSRGILKSPKKTTELNFFNDFGKEIEIEQENEKAKERRKRKEKEREREKEKENERDRLRDLKFEEERRNFESKILSLQQVVENQSKSVADLRDLTATLRLGRQAPRLFVGLYIRLTFIFCVLHCPSKPHLYYSICFNCLIVTFFQ
jgi:hypothetical protein